MNDYGVLFKIQPDGTGFTVIHNFTGNAGDGGRPYGRVVLFDGSLFPWCEKTLNPENSG